MEVLPALATACRSGERSVTGRPSKKYSREGKFLGYLRTISWWTCCRDVMPGESLKSLSPNWTFTVTDIQINTTHPFRRNYTQARRTNSDNACSTLLNAFEGNKDRWFGYGFKGKQKGFICKLQGRIPSYHYQIWLSRYTLLKIPILLSALACIPIIIMGGFFGKLFSKLAGKKQMKIIIIGLDNSGKTTILNKLHLNEVRQTAPTIGFNMEVVQYKNLQFQVWDLGGQNSIRQYWQMYYPNTNAILYVVDSHDKTRFAKATEELNKVLEKEILEGVPLLVMANKQDMPDAASEKEITEILGLSRIKERSWALFKCSALSGAGLNESMDWVVEKLAPLM